MDHRVKCLNIIEFVNIMVCQRYSKRPRDEHVSFSTPYGPKLKDVQTGSRTFSERSHPTRPSCNHSKFDATKSTHQPDKREPVLPPCILGQELVRTQVREEPNTGDAGQREGRRLGEYSR